MPPPQLHRWLSTTAKSRQNIREDSARAIEEKLGLARGALDRESHPVGADQSGTAIPTEQQQASYSANPQLNPRHAALIELFDGLTASQQDEVIRRLEDTKQGNDALIQELLQKRKA